MILLDTNVLSECMRPAPAPVVIDWLDAQDPQQVWICAISRAEIELGIALLPEGKRKRGLRQAATTLFTLDFPGRCLTFDESAASAYAHLVAHRTHLGQPISVEDAQIAAIALATGLTLATRNTRDFVAIDGLVIVNPWSVA